MHVYPSEVSVISMPTVNLFYLQIRGENAAILTSHSLSVDTQDLSSEPTKDNIYPALRAEPEGWGLGSKPTGIES